MIAQIVVANDRKRISLRRVVTLLRNYLSAMDVPKIWVHDKQVNKTLTRTVYESELLSIK